MRTSEGFNKERRSRNRNSDEGDGESERVKPINKEGGAVPGEKAPKSTWKERLQEKRDKIQTKHGKLVDPSDLDALQEQKS